MRGSELMRRYIEAVRADVRHGGKPAARQRHLDRLSAMRAQLASRHVSGQDTMEEALRELASFALSPRTSPRGAPTEPPRGRRAGDEVSLYTVNDRRRRGGR